MLPGLSVTFVTMTYQEVLIIDAKPLSEVSKHQRAVLLELEMAGHVLPVCAHKKNQDIINYILRDAVTTEEYFKAIMRVKTYCTVSNVL